MATPKPKSGYKTKRKYSCPYCDEKMIRMELVEHVENEHQSMIPQGYTAARVVYDHINGKNYGTCFVCGDKVYEWDDRLWRYKNLCNKPSCREAVHKKAMSNNLNDPEKQKIMLQGRKISGEYKFSDGQKRSYTGTYEKKALEFMDKVMNIPSDDIITPGPVFDYTYNGEKHKWITDILYVPAMLVIDVKDGGNNPNTRPMESYREKQIEKEKAIVKDGKYNYLRLTDNDFGQFMSAIADIRYGDCINDPKKGIYINEGAMPPAHCSQDYIIPCGMQGMNSDDCDEFIFGNTAMDKVFHFDKQGKLILESADKVPGKKKFRKVKFNKPSIIKRGILQKAKQAVINNECKSIQEYLVEKLLEKPYTGISDLYFSEFTEIDASPVVYEISKSTREMKDCFLNEAVVKTMGKHLLLMKDTSGYYLTTTDKDYNIVSDYYESIDDISPELVELMDNLYEQNKNKGDDSNDI